MSAAYLDLLTLASQSAMYFYEVTAEVSCFAPGPRRPDNDFRLQGHNLVVVLFQFASFIARYTEADMVEDDVSRTTAFKDGIKTKLFPAPSLPERGL